ncbi:PREDICTED: taste receptor type 2 member 14-like [Sturnus vulgaris]|uniref:taste receptor type 2 member 14-like n=1 Tax=Sturnus vulgaris TaxID=9172 RepID=UPI00071A658F|nr:PREDICTED: taste receptor type 2 member 14-like [Sturnus vulgaris]
MEACHSPQQSNVTTYGDTTVAIISLEAFAGMWINAFMVCVLCIGWVKKKTLNSNEKILLLLGCSRFWYLGISWVYSFLLIIHPYCFCVPLLLESLAAIQSFFDCSHIWMSACLCSFYCIKIANFRNSFFIYLKVKIDKIVPWLLLGSLLLAFIFSILVYHISNETQCNNRNYSSQGYYLKHIIRVDEHLLPIVFVIGFVYSTSFTAVVFSAVFLLFSLWKHKCKMQTNSMKDLSMDAHIKAMKSILSFLVMYSINFVFFILTLIYARKKENHVAFLIFVFLYAFPGVHSLILIFSNPKLEQALIRILSCVKCKVCMR